MVISDLYVCSFRIARISVSINTGDWNRFDRIGIPYFIARPASVFLTMVFSKFNFKEKVFISWVGLRGSIPIILGTFPLVAGIENANMIFNMVFFIVITSVVIQGWSIPKVATYLGLAEKEVQQIKSPIEFEPLRKTDRVLEEFIIPFNSSIDGKKLVDLRLPENALIVLVCRDEEFLLPKGETILHSGDVLQVLTDKSLIKEIYEKLI
jgi:NhaP-type Na+/H+ and K+/H+ antiporters with a unique C-terminal domain